MKKRVCFERHGQTTAAEVNPQTGEKIDNSRVLTDIGRGQGANAGKKVANIRFDKIFCSSAQRTVQTAEATLGTSHD